MDLKNLGTGLLPQEDDLKDFKAETLGISPVKTLETIELKLPTFVYDQGKSMLCTSYAIAMASHMLNGEKAKFSPTSIYGRKPNEGEGARLRDMMNLWRKGGICLSYLYDEYLTYPECKREYEENKKESDFVSQIGRIRYFYKIESKEDVVKALKLGNPIVGSVTIHSNFIPDSNGVIPLPNNKVVGGHALLVVGYDNKTDRVKVLNSWGKKWGKNGTAWMPYEMLSTSYVPVDSNTTVQEVYFQIGNKNYYKNGKKVEMDVAPFIKDNRTFVPIAHACNSLDVNYEWNGAVKSIRILK